MTSPCNRFKGIEGKLEPAIFCKLIENGCNKKDAVRYAKRKFCFRDTSKMLYGPASCKALRVHTENIGKTQKPLKYTNVCLSYKNKLQEETEMDLKINSCNDVIEQKRKQNQRDNHEEDIEIFLEQQKEIDNKYELDMKNRKKLIKKIQRITKTNNEKQNSPFVYFQKLKLKNFASYIDQKNQDQENEKELIPEIQFNKPFGDILSFENYEKLIIDENDMGKNKQLREVYESDKLENELSKIKQNKGSTKKLEIKNFDNLNTVNIIVDQSKMIKRMNGLKNLDCSTKLDIQQEKLLLMQKKFNDIENKINLKTRECIVNQFNQSIYLPKTKQQKKDYSNLNPQEISQKFLSKTRIESSKINVSSRNLEMMLKTKQIIFDKAKKNAQKINKQTLNKTHQNFTIKQNTKTQNFL